MKVYSHIQQFEPGIKPIVFTLGTFDGVHLAHKKIINILIQQSLKIGGESVVLTFDIHPRKMLNKHIDIKLLTLKEQKIAHFKRLGVQHLIIHPFDNDFANITAENFIEKTLCNQIKINKIIVGYNHQFGKNREGSFQNLLSLQDKFGYNVVEIPKQNINSVRLSSTNIRKALNEGNIMEANTSLGYKYNFKGVVVRGFQNGKTINFPTANIQVGNTTVLIPKVGVYAVQVELNGEIFRAMLNIGTNPTVGYDNERKIEVHIFDFNQEIYGKSITIFFIKKLRDEKKFENLEKLKNQLKKDKVQALKVFFEL